MNKMIRKIIKQITAKDSVTQKEKFLYNNGIFTGKSMIAKKRNILFLALLGIVIVVVYSAYMNAKEVEKQIKQNIEDVAQQNAAVLYSKIHAEHELLSSLAKELQGVTPDIMEKKLKEFEIFIENFNIKRFAITFSNGMTYSTDGEVTDLSYREFYKNGMEGKCSLTGVLSDALRPEHGQVNVMTIPIMNEEGAVTGVFGLAYDTKSFNESMQIESFGGAGCSFAVNEDGQIMMITGNDTLEISKNLFEELLEYDSRNEEVVLGLQSMMEKQEAGEGLLYLTEKYYYYCVPIGLMDGTVPWYVFTMIPSGLFQDRTYTIQMNQYVSSFLVVVLVLMGVVMIIVSLSEQNRQMFQLAYVDSVTGGSNFEKFWSDMEKQRNRQGYIISMSIANFSNIAIAAGEIASETRIRETWKLICDSLNKEELAGHVQDDQFLIFWAAEEEEELIRRLEQLSTRIVKENKEVHVFGIHAVYGIYRLSENERLEVAYSKAKTARSYVQTSQGVNYAFYSETDNQRTQREKELEERLPIALAEKEFEVWYQPKYSAADCKVVGSEALVRWRKKNGELISPGVFIPLFEQNGMIMKVDEYMFRSVCMQQKKWQDEGRKMYPVSVNISRASLYYEDVVQRYQKIIQESGVSPEYIQLEITETVVERKTDVYSLLNKFRQMGVKILMDDFGTGSSSLATLSTQCFDTLKLDKSLIDHIGEQSGEIMLYHIIRMGHKLGLHITAEGVEKQTQLEFLRDLDCDDIQGFYLSKPISAEEYGDMLKQQKVYI